MSSVENNTLKVLSFNVWGLAFVSKDRKIRIKAIAEYLASSSFDIVCLQELWIYKDFEIVREEVLQNLPFSRFFHTGALGSGLAIFTRYPLISAQALPYSLSGAPYQAIAGDFFVNKAAANVVLLHPALGEIEVWNTHMHAAGEGGPETDQAHRMTQSWQLANAIRSGAAKGRYIICMGDFNSQPWSIPISILRTHSLLSDSFLDTHPSCTSAISPPASPETSLATFGMTCDSPLNSYSTGKNIPQDVLDRGGKRLDYIFYRQPSPAKRRPLIWKTSRSRSPGAGGAGGGGIEEGQDIADTAPRLRCSESKVVLTDRVAGRNVSYSDHFGLSSTFVVDTPSAPSTTGDDSLGRSSASSKAPLLPLIDTPSLLNDTTTTFTTPHSPTLSKSYRAATRSEKQVVIQSALGTLRNYTLMSQRTATMQLRVFFLSVPLLVGLIVASAFQPIKYVQPVFTLAGGLLGALGATMLYTGFVWGRWEEGLLMEVTQEMELELRVVEMEDQM
ncbi:sphingomyelin phosphodiesterase 2, partial [Tremellales sp. Uapishka_1]